MSKSDEMDNKFNETAYDISKLLISLSTGTLVLSVTVHQMLLKTVLQWKFLLLLGWVLELASVILGTLFLLAMLRVYDKWAKIDGYDKPAVALGWMQYGTFIGGLISLGVFTALNLK
jgi:hypothetical protein